MYFDVFSDNWLKFVSGGLTMFTILTGIAVLTFFHKSVWRSFSDKEALTNSQLLIIGVYCGFLGQVFDNSYWEIAWTYNLLAPDSAIREWLFSNGVNFNVPFRQVLGSLAAYFHIKAALVTTKKEDGRLAILLWSFAVLSTVYAILKIVSYFSILM